MFGILDDCFRVDADVVSAWVFETSFVFLVLLLADFEVSLRPLALPPADADLLAKSCLFRSIKLVVLAGAAY